MSRDYHYKRSEYAAITVLEYWIVDPMQGQVTVLIWKEGISEEVRFAEDEVIEPQQFPELGLTAVGRTTPSPLWMNNENVVNARALWVLSGWHPPI